MKVTTALILALLTAAACDVTCDPDQVLSNEECVYPTPAAPDLGGDLAKGSSDGAGSCTSPNGGFGAACANVTDCPCGLDYCLPYQGGICTHTGCLADPSLCPAGWMCVDLSTYGAGLPAVCVKP